MKSHYCEERRKHHLCTASYCKCSCHKYTSLAVCAMCGISGTSPASIGLHLKTAHKVLNVDYKTQVLQVEHPGYRGAR